MIELVGVVGNAIGEPRIAEDKMLTVGVQSKAEKEPVEQRLAGSLACATIAALKGAHIIRVHDVKETVQAVRVVTATQYGA